MQNSASFSRTANRRKHTADAPAALGRSGERRELGKSASGLVGEVLCLSDNPNINSFVQRSWLPGGDPALSYRLNGVPIADMPNDVSLAIGRPDEQPQRGALVANKSPERYARVAVLTGGALNKCRDGRTDVFVDDYTPVVEQKIRR
jgi:hypothetical protein